MANYFEVTNDNNIVTIDDTYKYFYEIGTLPIASGASSPTQIPTSEFWVFKAVYLSRANINKVDTWLYTQGDKLYQNYTYYCYITNVSTSRLFGIRFKKSDDSVYVRLHKTVLGQRITGNSSYNGLMVEVVVPNASLSASSIQSYINNNFEIVELGNTLYEQAPSDSKGLAIYDSTGATIFHSSKKVVNISEYFSGNVAGSYTRSSFGVHDIVIPNTNFATSGVSVGGGGFNIQFWCKRDWWRRSGTTLQNIVLEQTCKRTSQYDDGGIWDYREWGTNDSSTPYISGMIAKSLY